MIYLVLALPQLLLGSALSQLLQGDPSAAGGRPQDSRLADHPSIGAGTVKGVLTRKS